MEAWGPLSGYLVLDISQWIAGPVGCTLLSDMGAEVIKVEPIEGEATRYFDQAVPLESLAFILFNRGKKSLPVDLRMPDGQEIVHRLIRKADAAVVGHRPDIGSGLGVDYETCAALNPGLVYCQNSAFGSEGPLADLAGFDIVVQAFSGLIAVNEAVTAEGQPRPIVPAVADLMTGSIIAWAVTAGLLARERTGRGQKVETSLLATALTMQVGRFRYVDALDHENLPAFLEKLAEARCENRPWSEMLALRQMVRPTPRANIYYRAYSTRESQLMVGCLNNGQRVQFLEATGLSDPRMVDGILDFSLRLEDDEAAALVKSAQEVMASLTTDEWVETLRRRKVPAGPLRFPEELLGDPQIAASDLLSSLEHPLLGSYRTVAPPVRMSQTPLAIQSPAPLFGADTRAILLDLGYCAAEIDRLATQRVVAVRE